MEIDPGELVYGHHRRLPHYDELRRLAIDCTSSLWTLGNGFGDKYTRVLKGVTKSSTVPPTAIAKRKTSDHDSDHDSVSNDNMTQ